MTAQIEIPLNQIRNFCRKWKIVEFSLFGSVLRDDFGPKSDVDVLVTFAPSVRHGLFGKMNMADELKEILGRNVDIVQEKLLENPFRRREILKTKEVIYAAGSSAAQT